MFEQYQKARTQFVQTVAELSTRPQNIETLQAAGVMQLLRPLLLDVVPTVQAQFFKLNLFETPFDYITLE